MPIAHPASRHQEPITALLQAERGWLAEGIVDVAHVAATRHDLVQQRAALAVELQIPRMSVRKRSESIHGRFSSPTPRGDERGR